MAENINDVKGFFLSFSFAYLCCQIIVQLIKNTTKMKEILKIDGHLEALAIGELCLPITAENVHRLLVNGNPPPYDGQPFEPDRCFRLAEPSARPMLMQWLEIGLAKFADYTYVEIGGRLYDIYHIKLDYPQNGGEGCPTNKLCFIICFDI